MSVLPGLAAMGELVRIFQGATDVNANKDFWENIAK